MKLAALVFAMWQLPAMGLIVTNGPSFNTNAPSNPLVGWQYTGSHIDGRGFVATVIGPRLAVTVTHIGQMGAIFYRDKFYIADKLIFTNDLQFICLKDFVPAWAPVFPGLSTNLPYANYTIGDIGWLIGDGARSIGSTDGIRYYWGPDDGVKRWGRTGPVTTYPGKSNATMRYDTGGPGAGDSGGAAFLSTGEFLCPISWGWSPIVIGRSMPVGALVGPHMGMPELQPYLTNAIPQVPPKPAPVTGIAVSRK